MDGPVDRRSGLLPPGLVQSSGIDAVEAKFVDQPKHDGLGLRIVACDRQGNATRGAPRLTALEQVPGIDVLNALITGRPSCRSTQRLSGMPFSMSLMRPSRCCG
jgi:hypothetical protein